MGEEIYMVDWSVYDGRHSAAPERVSLRRAFKNERAAQAFHKKLTENAKEIGIDLMATIQTLALHQ